MKVFIVGLGTIGELLAKIFLDKKEELEIDEVIVHKNTATKKHMGSLQRICAQGARLAVYESSWDAFEGLALRGAPQPFYTFQDALSTADIVITCAVKGIGNKLKTEYYCHDDMTKKLFIAQGSETGFGTPYMFGVNDDALVTNEKFIQVVSCNTHQILSILHTLVLRDHEKTILESGRFFLARRSNDISQTKSIVGVEVSIPEDTCYGSHQGADAAHVLKSVGIDVNLHAVAGKFNNSFMHVVYFNLRLSEKISIEEAAALFNANPLTAVTYYTSNNEVFSEGRNWGYSGKILNQTVVCIPALQIISDGYEIVGSCFTPQDSNVVLSSVALVARYTDPKNYKDTMKKIFYRPPFLFDII